MYHGEREDRRRSRSRSPRRRRERDDEHHGGGGGSGWEDGRSRGGGGGFRRGRDDERELKSYKQFVGDLSDVPTAEAEGRYALYKSEHGAAAHKKYFQSHMDAEWMRASFDPRRLAVQFKQRSEAAALAVEAFDVAAALQADGGADEADTDESQRAARLRRVAHDAERAHAAIRVLDAEKGITGARLQDASDTCAATWESDPLIARRTLAACVSYLWHVHGADYFGGKELRLAEYANRLSGVPSPAPADAGQGAPWEAAVDAFWASRLSAGDPVVASIGADRVEKAVAALLDASVKKIEEKKFGCTVHSCGKLFMDADFVRKHVASKHPELLEREHELALNKVFEANYIQHAVAAAAEEGPPRPPRAEGGERDGSRRGGGHRGGEGGGHPPRGGRGGGFNGGFNGPMLAAPHFHPMVLSPPEGMAFPMAPMVAPVISYVDLDAATATTSARPVLDYGDL